MKKINIDIPDGYEIDVESSDLAKGEIALKPVQKKFKDFGETECWFFGLHNIPRSRVDVPYFFEDGYPTEELLIAAEAQRRLLFWRNRVWKEDGNWKPNWEKGEDKYVIIVYRNSIIKNISLSKSVLLSFRTKEIRDQFLIEHEDLINQAKPLL